ncbi:MAG: hypothetical protein P4L73_08625 [Caulobacteraceae bacterium]|nr:hypothetical protein [Caulobacteraceae bacterium]
MRVILSASALIAVLAVSACSLPPWKEYPYPAWGFAASFRVPPKVTETPASADGATPHNIVVEAVQGGRRLVVAATDASTSTKSDDQLLSQVPQAMAESQGGKVGTVTYVAIGKVVGREAMIELPDKTTQRVRVFVAGKKLYQLAAQSPLGPQDSEVVQFLDSVRLTGP